MVTSQHIWHGICTPPRMTPTSSSPSSGSAPYWFPTPPFICVLHQKRRGWGGTVLILTHIHYCCVTSVRYVLRLKEPTSTNSGTPPLDLLGPLSLYIQVKANGTEQVHDQIIWLLLWNENVHVQSDGGVCLYFKSRNWCEAAPPLSRWHVNAAGSAAGETIPLCHPAWRLDGVVHTECRLYGGALGPWHVRWRQHAHSIFSSLHWPCMTGLSEPFPAAFTSLCGPCTVGDI